MPAITMEPPVGGINSKDSLGGLRENEALEMVNWIPDVGYCRSRNGNVLHTDLETAKPIGTLIPLRLPSGSYVLAVSNLTIFEITDVSVLLPVVTAVKEALDAPEVLQSDRLTYAQFKGVGILCQKGNTPFIYNPAIAAPNNLVLGVYTQWVDPDLPAPDPLILKDLVKPCVFKNRVIYADAEKLSVWYAQAGSYQGELTEFPLDGVFQHGGKIALSFTWSKDTGDGMDDMYVVISTNGECLAYQGDDPDSVLGWELIQRYQLPHPIADYGLTRIGSEVIIITDDGFINLSEAISQGQVSDYATFSNKLTRMLKSDLERYQQNYGWQAIFHPHGSMALFNVPIQEDKQHYQYVFNTRNGAWTTFAGWNANCFATIDDQLLMGGIDGRILLCNVGSSDEGNAIVCGSQSAYTQLGDPTSTKHMTAMTVIHNHNYPSAFSLDAVADFRRPKLPPLVPPQEQVVAQWDISNWDTDYWGIGESIPDGKKWRRPIQATGHAISFSVRQQSRNQTVFWFASIIEYTMGGIK